MPWILLARSAADRATGGATTAGAAALGFMVAVHHWLLPSLNVFLVVLAALLGALWAPWGWLVRRFLGGAPGPGRVAAALLVLPSGWLMVELVRSWQGLGGPWGLLGSSQWQVTPALRLASIGGVWLLSFLVVAVNTAIAVLVVGAVRPGCRPSPRSSPPPPRPRRPGSWAPRPESTAASGSPSYSPAWSTAPQRGPVRPRGAAHPARSPARASTWSCGARAVSATTWPAGPTWPTRLAALSRATGADILVNVDARRSDRPGIYKSSVLVGPDGPTGDRYDKMRLVPFGEYIPARSLLGWATSSARRPARTGSRGTGQVVMNVGHGLRIGPLVCFETAFPDMSRHLAEDGANVLLAPVLDVVVPAQLGARRSTPRSARCGRPETGRPMVHATLTGVSRGVRPERRADRPGSAPTAAPHRCTRCHWVRVSRSS